MKATQVNWITSLLFGLALFFTCAVHGQQTEAVLKYFQETKAKAEKGDALAQTYLGYMYRIGHGVSKAEMESVKWFRKAADQGHAEAQSNLGYIYDKGRGVAKDEVAAVKWYRKAADQGNAMAQYNIGLLYYKGRGVAKDEVEAAKWCRKAADQGHADAQFNLGAMYGAGRGVAKNAVEAVKWYCKAADQGNADAQYGLGYSYANGFGVAKDVVKAYKLMLLAEAQGDGNAKEAREILERQLTKAQIAAGNQPVDTWDDSQPQKPVKPITLADINHPRFAGFGSGFFITDDGYFITNHHVAKVGTPVLLVIDSTRIIQATVVRDDAEHDLSLIKASGKFIGLPILASQHVRLGTPVAALGFPDPVRQGFLPKFTKGEISSLAGIRDEAHRFQISVPIQGGNSGGALFDEYGNAVGVMAAHISIRKKTDGSPNLDKIPQLVNYAVKSDYILKLVETVPGLKAKLKAPVKTERKFVDLVAQMQKSSVGQVLVYDK